MIRRRMLVLGASASILLTGALAPAALAGSHWSNAKCSKTYVAWYRHHFGSGTHSFSPKQDKELSSYLRKLHREHHCVIGG